MGERKKYRAVVNGNETVLNLTAADAAALYPQAVPVEEVAVAGARPRRAAKARSAPNKARLDAASDVPPPADK